jgi:ABC-type dipeptide/oligopeptide/nickel transport system ATPase component
MSSMTNAFENSLALLLFNNTTLANIGDATGLVGSSGAGSTQMALSTSALSDTDTLLTATEVAYTGYARPTQARSGAGWTVASDTASNAALVQFGEMSAGGPDTVVHVGLGFISTGDVLRLHQDLAADLVINNGVNPQFAIGAMDWVFA